MPKLSKWRLHGGVEADLLSRNEVMDEIRSPCPDTEHIEEENCSYDNDLYSEQPDQIRRCFCSEAERDECARGL